MNLENIKDVELHLLTDAGEHEDRVKVEVAERAHSEVTLQVSHLGGVVGAPDTVLVTSVIVWLTDTPTGPSWNQRVTRSVYSALKGH